MQSKRVVRNPTGRLRPLSEATASEILYHGGCIRIPGPYGDDAKAEAAAKALHDSIHAGLDALENGTSEFAPDVEAVPNAPVEVFDLFDIQTGENLMIWRVACRQRGRYAN